VTEPAREVRSLTSRLLGGMVVPMVALAVALGVGGAWAIAATVESVNDRILSAASRGIADSLAVEGNEITIDLSPAIFGMLENNARDNVYYSVRYRGRFLTGYADLPQIVPDALADTDLTFRNGDYLGHPVRIVAEARRLPQIREPVIVEVAETLDARERTTRRLLIGLALLEATLIGVAAFLLPPVVRWGLRPVARVRDEMDRRAATDLTPLPLTSVPAELRDLVRAFNAMLARLDAGIRGMRRFTADASHQMRTPLSILRAHVAVLRQARPGSAEAASSIDDIDQASNRLSHLLVQLIALARADSAAPRQLALEPIDLNGIAEAVASEHALEAVRAGIDLHFDRAADPAMARADSALATELVSNLVDNAIRYNRPGGTVSVLVDRARATIAIEDDGPGIAPRDRERVFMRFMRLKRDARTDGSGLGLPIARSLAEALGARLTLQTPQSGKGIRVEVAFVAEV
jgi:two-component system sensor histidine kinase TctE